MADINLAPGSQYLAAVRKRRRRLYVGAVVIVAVCVLVWGGLFLLRQQLTNEKLEVENQLAAVQTEINRLGPDAERVRLFEGRLQTLGALLDGHVNVDVLFQEMERLLPAPTVLTKINVQLDEGALDVTGTTADIDQIAQTLTSVTSSASRPTLFTDAQLGSVQREEQSGAEGEPSVVQYTFAATFSFDTARLRAVEVQP